MSFDRRDSNLAFTLRVLKRVLEREGCKRSFYCMRSIATPTLLFDEIHVSSVILYKSHFKSVDSQ